MDGTQPETKHSFKTRSRNTSLHVVSTGFQHCPPGFGWGPGIRDHYLIHFVTAGEGQLTANGETFHLHIGEMFLIYPGDTVQYTASQTDPWSYSWVGFDGQDAPFLLRQAGFSRRLPMVASGCPESFADLMMAVYDSRGSQVHEITRMTGRLYEFLAALIELSPSGGDGREDPALASVRTSATFIDGNYSRPISIDEIAAFANVSRSALYRSFRRHLGVTPMQYLAQCRINRACTLLQGAETTISEVARSVGFEDPLYFSRVFKARQGCSPRQYLNRRPT